MGFGRGGQRGGRGRGGGGGGNYRRPFQDQGPPSQVIEVGHFTHPCENDIVCRTTCGKIPYFNAPVFFENKEQIGKIDEIFGGIKDNGFSVKLNEGLKSSSFKDNQMIYIDPMKLLPIERFLSGDKAGGRGRGSGGPKRGGPMRGGRGTSFRGRGAHSDRGGRGGYTGGNRGNEGGRGGSFGGGRGGSFGGGRGGQRGRGFNNNQGSSFKRPFDGGRGGRGGGSFAKKKKFDE